jgi:ribonuclease HII
MAAGTLAGLRDSKQLTALQRERYFELIREMALAVGVGVVGAWVVDRLGLSEAGRRAMASAVEALPITPDFLLLDAFALPSVPIPQRALVFGDCLSVSIAAASVVAKVTRDRLMGALHQQHPAYGFCDHKGYGTRRHREALAVHGTCEQHRVSYAPIRSLVAAVG